MSGTEIGKRSWTYLLGAPSVVSGGAASDSWIFALV